MRVSDRTGGTMGGSARGHVGAGVVGALLLAAGLMAGGLGGCGAKRPAPTTAAAAAEGGTPRVTPGAEGMSGHPPTTAQDARGEGPRPTRVTRIQVWAPSGEMYVSRPDGTLEPVEAKDAVYLDDRGSYALRASAVVFIQPATGHVWAGPRAEGYLDTPDGIIGVSVADGVVCWCDSGIRAARPGDTLDSLAQRFEGQKLSLRLFDARQGSQSDVRAFVEEAFFGERPGSAGFGKAHLISLGLDGQTVEMELASPTDAFRAFLRFDLKTRSLLRAVDHAGEETPRSVLQNLVKDVHEIRPVAAGDRVPLKVGKQSITGFYRVGKGPTTEPATPDDADVAVTLSWFEGAEQAQAAFRQRVEARHGTPSSPANAPYPFKPLLTYRWPDGRILQCLANRIVEVEPRRPVPGDVGSNCSGRACGDGPGGGCRKSSGAFSPDPVVEPWLIAGVYTCRVRIV